MESGSILTESGRNKPLREYLTKSEVRKEIPSSFFLALAAGATALSLGLSLSQKRRNLAIFTAQMVPAILLLGIYENIANPRKSSKTGSQSLLH